MQTFNHILLLALVLLGVAAVVSAAVDEDGYDYVPREDGEEEGPSSSSGTGDRDGGERRERPMEDDYDARSSSSHHDSSSSSTPSQELAKLSKDDQLMVLEDALEDVRKHQVRPALERVSRLTGLHGTAKANSGWIKSAAEKKRIHSLEQELNQATNSLVKAQSKEMDIYNSMKPLYGIVSYQFMQEQQASIQGSLKKMNKMAYDNAWWSSVFNSGRAESLTDLIAQFFIQWLMAYIVMYPFAVVYYAFWTAPWAIYAYSSGATDVVPGLLAWLAGTLIMVLPLVCLGVGGYFVAAKYGPELARKAREGQERAQQRRQQQEGANQRTMQRMLLQQQQQQQYQQQQEQQRRQARAAGAGVGAMD